MKNVYEEFGHDFKLETNRMIITIIKGKYISDYMEYYAGKKICKYLDWDGPKNEAEAMQYFCMWEKCFIDGEILPLAIINKRNNKMIGSIIISEFTEIRADIGYELGEMYWNQGIMSEVLQSIIPIIFSKMNIKRIQAIVFKGNIASEKVLIKLGFLKEGLLKKYSYSVVKKEAIDSYIYSLIS